MSDPYAVNCDYGGIGNFQEGDTACMLCPHEVECSHETELAALAEERARRRARGPWRNSDRAGGGGTRIATTGPSSGPFSERTRSRRPLPVAGESPFSRMIKNAVASMLSSGFHELGSFWDVHDFAPSTQLPDGGAENSKPNKK